MLELMDPAIKLFGQTIPLQESVPSEAAASEMVDEVAPEVASNDEPETEGCDAKMDSLKEAEGADANCSSSLNNAVEEAHQSNTEDEVAVADPNGEQVESNANGDGGSAGQDKVLKKPDKILPCPRCNSMETKFCYYNNYNINQPRHFCKNCQRYWTAGGTMRNVPVGAGRRKNKHSASHYRQMMMPPEISTSANHDVISGGPSAVPVMPTQGSEHVLKFGADAAPLCKSMVSALKINEPKKGGNPDEAHCSMSSAAAPHLVQNGIPEKTVNANKNDSQSYCNAAAPPLPQCFPGAPFVYPWSMGWNNAAQAMVGKTSSQAVYMAENNCPGPIPWLPSALVPIPAFCPPTLPFPFMPPPIWAWPNGLLNVPWVGGISPPSSANSGCSGSSGSPALGKHSRDSGLQEDVKKEKSLWVPKTLRIDDPDEAAKSSIWATLGIKHEEIGIYKSIQPKSGTKNQTPDSDQVLHANPAALSRLHSFQESS